ncbi:hypothetical protein [Streptomyces kronopolitis]|uniref:hypothetical protein n=1 Tax=Streptomyces kronopolitis TaxID=1612435 RepID=UPI0016674ECB|nr:hypothetical protein [Streptomyces kronopolitis]
MARLAPAPWSGVSREEAQAPLSVASAPPQEPAAEMWFWPPEGYFAFPLEDWQEPLGKIWEALREIPGTAQADPSPLQLMELFGGILGMLEGQDVIHLSIGAHPEEDGSAFMLSVLTVSEQPLGVARPALALAGALKALGTGGATQVNMVDLPCGPALLSDGVERAPAPPARDGTDPHDAEDSVWRGTVLIPSPTGSSVYLMQLTTAALAHAAEYREILLAMAHTVTFDSPDGPSPAEDPAAIRRREVEEHTRKAFG